MATVIILTSVIIFFFAIIYIGIAIVEIMADSDREDRRYGYQPKKSTKVKQPSPPRSGSGVPIKPQEGSK